jgi:hypothetical protein
MMTNGRKLARGIIILLLVVISLSGSISYSGSLVFIESESSEDNIQKCKDSSFYNEIEFSAVEIKQSELKTDINLRENFNVEGYYLVKYLDPIAETFQRIEREVNAEIIINQKKFDELTVELHSNRLNVVLPFINIGSHQIIGKNDEIYYVYDYNMVETEDSLVSMKHANIRFVIYNDHMELSFGGECNDGSFADFRGVSGKGYTKINPILSRVYESLHYKKNVITPTLEASKQLDYDALQKPVYILSVKEIEAVTNQMNLSIEDKQIIYHKILEWRNILNGTTTEEDLFIQSPSAANTPKPAGLTDERRVILATEIKDIQISPLTIQYVFTIIMKYYLIAPDEMTWLLKPTRSTFITYLKSYTDTSYYWWFQDRHLYYCIIGCHSDESTSKWNFVDGDVRYYVYGSDIASVWDARHSPQYCDVITFACHSYSANAMKYAWMNAKYYGANYNADLFSGSLVYMANAYFDLDYPHDLIDAILLLIVPDQTVDMWYLSIFWMYDISHDMLISIYFACSVYDAYWEGFGGVEPLIINFIMTNYKILH